MNTNAPPRPPSRRRTRWTRLAAATAVATATAVLMAGSGAPALPRTAPVSATDDAPGGFDLDAAAKLRAAQCLMTTMQRKGGQALKSVARTGLSGTDAQLLTAADREYFKDPRPPLAVAFETDRDYASAKMDELYNRHHEWEKSLDVNPPSGYTQTGFQWVEQKDNPFSTTGLSGWISDQYWQSEYDLFNQDQTPLASKESVDKVNAIAAARYSADRHEDYEDLRAFEGLTSMHPMYADDARIFLQNGGFPTTAPDPSGMEFRIDVEGLKSRFASCSTRNPADPHQVLGAEVVTASIEWQAEVDGQKTQRDTILGAEAAAAGDLQVAAQALGESLGQSTIASRLADWQAYWLKQTPQSAGLSYPSAADFAKVKSDIVKAQAMALGRLFVATRAAQDAKAQATKADAAQQAAYAIADAAGQPRGRGLLYGQQAAQVTKASAAATQAVSKATETASNATRASASDSKTLMALAQTQAHASQAEFRRAAAQEAADQAKAAADGAAVQATKAAENAAKAKAAQAKAEAAEQTAKAAAADAKAQRATAESERDKAKTQRDIAATERAKAATAEATAQTQRQAAATALSAAQTAGATAASKKDDAVAAEHRATTARAKALGAERDRDALNVRAAALEAQAAADDGTAAAAQSRAAATQARADADDATTAAANARAAANDATAAAEAADEAATRAEAAAARSKAASDKAQADVAITGAAVKKAHAAAADAIASSEAADQNARAAKALSDTAHAKATEAKANAAVSRVEANAAAASAVQTAGFAYATAQAALAARDAAAQVVRPANDAIELGSPYAETDASAGLAVLTGQAAKTASEQQAAVGQAKADQAAKASAEAAALAAAAKADAKAAATAAADAAASAAKATVSLNKARASAAEASAAAKAAVTAENHTVAYNQQAIDDAAAAADASSTASGYATEARHSADAAEQDAASARGAATAAERDAATARGVADHAEADATAAEAAAANAQQAAKDAQDAATRVELDKDDQEQSARLSADGSAGAQSVLRVPYNLKDEISSDGICQGTHTGSEIGCEYTINHHVTGTALYFVAICLVPDTAVGDCVGDLDVEYLTQAPIDITHTEKVHVDGVKLTEDILKGVISGMLSHITGCIQSPNLSDCAWAVVETAPLVLGTIGKTVQAMRAAVAANESLDALTAALKAEGIADKAAEGVAGGVKVSQIVAEQMAAVRTIAEAHGYTLNAFGKIVWGMQDGSLALRTADHIAKLKRLGITRAEIQKIYAAYKRVDEVKPANPSANQRWKLMQYILENWGG
ncbi:hypothetical protein [Streptomyces sp. NPDC086787]|uniref:hypothetical protein n=1 Tax=Streptomyces sp. NPDC086787 TaxID=3365759 RepID=UPI0038289255